MCGFVYNGILFYDVLSWVEIQNSNSVRQILTQPRPRCIRSPQSLSGRSRSRCPTRPCCEQRDVTVTARAPCEEGGGGGMGGGQHNGGRVCIYVMTRNSMLRCQLEPIKLTVCPNWKLVTEWTFHAWNEASTDINQTPSN